MVKKAHDSPPPEGKVIPIRWKGDQEAPLHFADQLHVRHVPGRFYLTFGQLNLPVFEGDPPPGLVAEIRATARIVVTEGELQNMVNALNGVLKKAEGKS